MLLCYQHLLNNVRRRERTLINYSDRQHNRTNKQIHRIFDSMRFFYVCLKLGLIMCQHKNSLHLLLLTQLKVQFFFHSRYSLFIHNYQHINYL